MFNKTWRKTKPHSERGRIRIKNGKYRKLTKQKKNIIRPICY